jgi:secretion/DNA translocation related TadE-like protein
MVPRDRGSATLWVLAASALLLTVAVVVLVRTLAVLARHRVEAAADFAALAAAGQIGVSDAICPAAKRLAAANGAQLVACVPTLAPDGRAGTVTVRVLGYADLPLVGRRPVIASARAGRLPGMTASASGSLWHADLRRGMVGHAGPSVGNRDQPGEVNQRCSCRSGPRDRPRLRCSPSAVRWTSTPPQTYAISSVSCSPAKPAWSST